jgi:hypothetical protein
MVASLRARLRMMSHRNLFSMISLVSALALSGLTILAVSPTIAASGATYYVAPDGDDSNPGTIDRPWRTIQKAANTLVAGDTVYVRGGTYSEQVNFTRSGSTSSPITFEAYPGEIPVVDGTGMSIPSPAVDNGLFDFEWGVHDVTIRGLHMRDSEGCFIEGNDVARIKLYDLDLDNSFSSLIRWQGSTNCVIENVRGHNCSRAYPGSTDGAEGIRIYGGSGVVIRNCEVWDFYNMAVDLFGGHSGGLVEDNYFHDDLNSYDWDAAIYLDGARNSVVRRNIVHNAHIGIQIGAEQPNEPVENNVVVNNVFYNNINGAIILKGAQSSSHTRGNLVAHNTGVNGPQSRNPVMWIRENSYDNHILNNILIARPSAQSYELVRIQDRGMDNTLDNNSYYGPSGYRFQIIGTGSGDWNWYRSQMSPEEADSQFADPLFVGGLDFSLASDSPCIDQGSDAGVTEDLLGASRPQGAGYDIGAYEYSGGTGPTATPTSTPIPTSTPNPTPTSTPIPSPPAQSVRRVNIAGQDYTDAGGGVWSADRAYSAGGWGYTGGNVASWGDLDIEGTDDDDLYTTERWLVSDYKFDLPNGTYYVVLHFAENNPTLAAPGRRVFDVAMEGEIVLDDFDPFAEAGFRKAIFRVADGVLVNDGRLDIVFVPETENPEINAIEVLPAGAPEAFVPLACHQRH